MKKVLKSILSFLIWLHQAPQNIIGLLFCITATEKIGVYCNDGEKVRIRFSRRVFGCGVSFGKYIFLDDDYYNPNKNKKLDYKNFYNTVNHEHGHQKQSLILGWLYLPVVGFTSAVCNNLYDRIFHKNKSSSWRERWYYSRFHENWADRLGGVKREKVKEVAVCGQ